MKKMFPIAMSLFLLVFCAKAFSANNRVSVPTGDSPSMGPENAPVLIVEFIDFQ